jgi:hypothetical protein
LGKDLPPQPRNADNVVVSLARSEADFTNASVPTATAWWCAGWKSGLRYFLEPPNRTNVLSSNSLVLLTARRRMHTIVKMIMIAVAIGIWIDLRSRHRIRYRCKLGFEVPAKLNSATPHLRSDPS